MTEAQRERRRKALLLLLALLILDTRDHVSGLVDRLVGRQIGSLDFGLALLLILQDSHAHAGYLGRRVGGITTPFGATDQEFGHQVALEQEPFVRGFIADIESGRYTNEDGSYKETQLRARADLYCRRLRGTANEAWVLSLPADTLIYWFMGGIENHCATCPEMEANNPHTPATLTQFPGDGQSECGTNCHCGLEADIEGQRVRGVPSLPVLIAMVDEE